MAGFESPNYTQVPNDLFSMLPDMGYAELKVILAIVRETFGYHRASARMSIRQLARATGLTPRNVEAGAAAAEARGLITRSVVAGDTTTWGAVVAGDTGVYPVGIRAVSPDTGKVGLKKERKRYTNIKEKEGIDQKLARFLAR